MGTRGDVESRVKLGLAPGAAILMHSNRRESVVELPPILKDIEEMGDQTLTLT